ncbi:MAG TPA: glycoside hydrolase family 15 protein [Gaiella sp.]|nr:glycoside hydrolase family 15 protein [Gaiella sp.]
MGEDRQLSDLALLSDCRSAALVDRAGAVVWWCPERFDAEAWFAGLLGDPGGSWSLAPAKVREVERRYEPDTLVLTTTFVTASGTVELREGLLFAAGARGHEIGRSSPAALARIVRCLSGEVEVTHRFDPRSAYGLVRPRFVRSGTLWEAHGSTSTMVLVGAEELEEEEDKKEGLVATVALRTGDERAFVCVLAAGDDAAAPLDAAAALQDTLLAWRSWTELHVRPEGIAASEVSLAVRVLQGLTYQPSGAVIAAPVTSLPEVVGEGWNWDYRYAWLRDSSLVAHALRRATCADETQRYLSWMARVAHDGDPGGETQAVFGVGGERLLHEATLDHLEGFAGSRPVRIGNAAWRQRQLDVYGHVLDAATAGEPDELDPVVQGFLCQIASRAARVWREPDHGIWERRCEQRHYTSSKLGCWTALEKALSLGDALGDDADLPAWRDERQEIRAWLEEAWDEERGAYPAWPGAAELDASMLLFVVDGFHAPTDRRSEAIVRAVERELGRGELLVRWTGAEDGAFLLCSCWHVQALAALNELGRAEEVLASVLACGNDLGLLPEEVDPATGQARGNVPLALSHAGLVAAVSAVERERDRATSKPAAA